MNIESDSIVMTNYSFLDAASNFMVMANFLYSWENSEFIDMASITLDQNSHKFRAH